MRTKWWLLSGPLPPSSPHLTQGFLQMGGSVSFQDYFAKLPPPLPSLDRGVVSEGELGFFCRPEATKATQGKC